MKFDKLILKHIWKCKGQSKLGKLFLPDVKTYYNATITKAVKYQYNERQIDQQERIGSP